MMMNVNIVKAVGLRDCKKNQEFYQSTHLGSKDSLLHKCL